MVNLKLYNTDAGIFKKVEKWQKDEKNIAYVFEGIVVCYKLGPLQRAIMKVQCLAL